LIRKNRSRLESGTLWLVNGLFLQAPIVVCATNRRCQQTRVSSFLNVHHVKQCYVPNRRLCSIREWSAVAGCSNPKDLAPLTYGAVKDVPGSSIVFTVSHSILSAALRCNSSKLNRQQRMSSFAIWGSCMIYSLPVVTLALFPPLRSCAIELISVRQHRGCS
jgi:hypothetical protein